MSLDARPFQGLLVAFVVAPLLCFTNGLYGQNRAPDPQALAPGAVQSSADDSTFTLRVTAREVVLDVVARDKAYRPVGDLKETDFNIFEIRSEEDKRQRRLSAFQLINPGVKASTTPVELGGFHVALSGGCAAGITVHYRLSFQPGADGWKGGYHEILVTTTRPGVTLTFRHTYYVGQNDEVAAKAVQNEAQGLASLKRAACFHGDIPASMAMNGHLVEATPDGVMRYSMVIKPDSLAFSSIADTQHRVELDYGACVFDAAGMAIQFMHHSIVAELSQTDYSKVVVNGFPNSIDLPRRPEASMVRLVVRDRSTGNLGILELSAGAEGRALKKDKPRNDDSFKIVNGRAMVVTHAVGSFGSIVPQAPAMCGDVYEVKPGTPKIITNFGEQDAVGRLYTPQLDVHQQRVVGGLPGATPNEEWFSIDYYGEFWTTVAGDYHFRLLSDDGANLYIDDEMVIEQDGIHPPIQGERTVKLDVGRHTLHLPYFQGPGVVSLILEVKAPGKAMEVMDMRKFGAPTGSP